MTSTRTNEEWLHDLRENGMAQGNAIADLQSILLRAVLYFFNRNLGDFRGLAREDILQLARDCAQEALISVLNHLSDFRGDSKFTTWAYKFAINTALIAVRHTRWKDVSLDQLFLSEDGAFSKWVIQNRSSAVVPDKSVMQGEVCQVIQEVLERDLTDKQRRVLLLIVFNEVPMDEVVHQLQTNRNAIYKMLHVARHKLKSGLEARGFEIGETLALFSSQK
jgi:RNA polymerase sigma-70 factor, ECF subfamily